MKRIFSLLAYAGLIITLSSPVLFLIDKVTESANHQWMLVGTCLWLVFGTLSQWAFPKDRSAGSS